jgi:hypothetical protein
MVPYYFLQSGKFDRSLFFSHSAAAMLTPKGSRLLTRMDEQPVEEK